MNTYEVHVRPVNNDVLSNALKEINTIMKEFDTKIFNVYSELEKEVDKLDNDSETAGIIADIMERIVDDLPDRICFMNELYYIASNASDDESEEDD